MISTSRRIISSLAILITGGVVAVSDGWGRDRFEFTEAHMGTQFRVVLYAPDSATAARAAEAAFERITRLDATMSDYRETSELNRLSRAAPHSFAVSHDLLKVLSKSLELSRRTGGAFDVTSGPLTRLWRHARRTGEMPDAERLARARKLTGYKNLELDERASEARLKIPGMLLDLGGIAKGYAADQAVAELKRYGISSALVAAGGDIVVSGPPPGTAGWTISMGQGRAGGFGSAALTLSNAAVSTSGDAEQYVEMRGIRYSHIVDPRTGLGVTGQSASTVIAADGMTADSLATAVSVLGVEEGIALVETVDRAAARISRIVEGRMMNFESRRWRELTVPRSRIKRDSESLSGEHSIGPFM